MPTELGRRRGQLGGQERDCTIEGSGRQARSGESKMHAQAVAQEMQRVEDRRAKDREVEVDKMRRSEGRPAGEDCSCWLVVS